VVELEHALRLKPDYAAAHSNLGLALGRLGRKQEAIAHFQEALRLKPDYQVARMNLELLMRMNK
jgi:Flp pilus assembly protein TadD